MYTGCSEGFIRIYDHTNSRFTYAARSHDSLILKLVSNKDATKLSSISSDNSVKIWQLSNSATVPTNQIEPLKLIHLFQLNGSNFSAVSSPTATNTNPFAFTASILAALRHADIELKAFNLSNMFAFDNSESFFFLINQTGAYLNEICGEQAERCQNIYELNGATTVELWNASTSCILLVGSSSGTVRVFKLLDQL